MPMGYKKEPKCPEIPAQKPGGGGSGNLNPILPAFFTVMNEWMNEWMNLYSIFARLLQ